MSLHAPTLTTITNRPIRKALLSVTDKTGLVEFARGLAAAGVELQQRPQEIAPAQWVELAAGLNQRMAIQAPSA